MPTPEFSRETIYAALFNQLQALAVATNPNARATVEAAGLTLEPKISNPPFQFCSRRYAPLQGLQVPQYPALMVLEKGEIFETPLYQGPSKVTLVAHIFIQILTEDINAIPATALNNLADQVQATIEQQPLPGVNDLYGNAFECRVTGREVIYIASKQGMWSEQDLEVQIIQSH